jgi:hypothetical protein
MLEAFAQKPPFLLQDTNSIAGQRSGRSVDGVDHGDLGVSLESNVDLFFSFAVAHDMLDDLEDFDGILMECAIE